MRKAQMQVPLLDLKRQTEALKPELMAAVERVLSSGQYILGEEVEAFETEAATYLNVKHAIGVASGTDALWLALKALDIGPGDQVLTTPFTFFATASAILNTGAEPVFADIDPSTYNLDPNQAEDVVKQLRANCSSGKALKAMIPVHLYGQPADMDALVDLAERNDLLLIEDAAQALGAEYQGRKAGTLGHIGCFSFFPTKNLGAFGDAGLVVTDDDALAKRLRLLRVHGASEKYHHELIGTNSRLDALQAALLRAKLRHLEKWIDSRQLIAATYDEVLERMELIEAPFRGPDRTHTYHQYTVRVHGGRRDELQTHLKEKGIGSAVYYPLPVHLQPALRYGREDNLPEAERAASEVLSLPIFPGMTNEEISYVINTLAALSSVVST